MHTAYRVAALAIALTTLPLAAGAQVDTKMATEAMAAKDKKDEAAGPWSGSIAAGYAKTSGNTDSSAANAKATVRYDQERWHHILSGTAIGTASAANRDEPSSTTAEAYWAGGKSQYDLTERYYAFGSIDWYKDRFSAYDSQLYEAIGLGWRVLRGPDFFLDLEAGAGATQSELQNGESQDSAIGLVRGLFNWKIGENATFSERAAVLSGSENTYVESTTELKTTITGALALVLAYTVKYNSDTTLDTSVTPPRNYDKTDTFTTISLEYAF